ncbi:MAG TPA: TIGR02281 family clan AA aspartic protease [Gammaproteobacteria bacterium]|nr:TIGR02281 family clan AA aspartic protease [Gammaproteobacteria bacterium]
MQDPAQQQKKIGATMLGVVWLGIFIILGIFFSDILDRQNNPNQSANTVSLSDGIKQLSLTRNHQGHYVANGTINGQPVVFMLDTGATVVSIPLAIANRLNLKKGPEIVSQTANGTTTSYITRLEQIAIGDIRLRDIPASINPGYKSEEILLGMSFLRHLEFTQRGNTLTLRQYPGSRSE